MNQYRYSVSLQGQLGSRPGTLFLRLEGPEVSGCLTILDQDSYFQGKVLRKNHLVCSSRLKLLGKDEDCDLLLRMEDGLLLGSLITSRGCWTLDGTLLEDPQGTAADSAVREEQNTDAL
jgi:hypothetical protein